MKLIKIIALALAAAGTLVATSCQQQQRTAGPTTGGGYVTPQK
jgi:hypothetical protein